MKYQVVADESVDFRIINQLRELGFNIYAIVEQQPSITDEMVLTVACENDALLITEDKDFGELVFRLQLPHRGILLIRVDERTEGIRSAVQAVSQYYPDLLGKFSVVTDKKLRIKE